ncbi:MAG: DegQ family serine endoprotease [Pyramidobacter sp.]|jgi:serine protease Do
MFRKFKGSCVSILCGAAFFAAAMVNPASALPTEVLSAESPIADMVTKVAPAVVNIDVEGTVTSRVGSGLQLPDDPLFREFFGDMFREYTRKVPMKGAGSGFIVSADGRILTNNHVIADADKITVTFSDGKTKEAKVIGKDPTFDIAVIKVEGKNFPTLEMGDSDKVRVGETLVAIGNTLGLGLEPTVTVGVLSARNRSVHVQNFNFDGFLQTDASINPGNSGGPLLDMNGRVIGINTAIIASAQGIGFAIPINMAKQVMNDIVTYGKVRRGKMGVYLQPLTEEMASAFDLKSTDGALIAEVVADSPAEKAGLKRGDIITKIDGKKVENSTQLSTTVRQHMAGDTIKLEVIRNGKTMNFSLVLSEVDTTVADAAMADKLGFSVSAITPELRKELKLSERDSGVVVTDVEAKSSAMRSGLRRGDLILQANGRDVKKPDDLYKALNSSSRKRVPLLISRGGRTLYLPLNVK